MARNHWSNSELLSHHKLLLHLRFDSCMLTSNTEAQLHLENYIPACTGGGWVGEGHQHRGALCTDCLSITGLIQTDRCSYTQVCTSGQLKDFPHLRVLRNERNHFARFKENMDMVRLQIGGGPTSNMEVSR